jgi:3-isopropylmalate/(R)-2-methylmalate dehydratase small subunit
MSEIVKITNIEGRAVTIRGNDIDTDRIIPARYLKEVSFARMGEYPFFDERFDASGNLKPHPLNDPKFQGASLLFVNKHFGCGSSREHAPQALYRWGINAIVGESFAAIFGGNCTMMGLPTVTVSPDDIENLMQAVENDPRTTFSLDLQAKTISFGEHKVAIDLPETYRSALTSGSWDSTAMLRANLSQVKKTATNLPYMNNFAG